MNKIAYLILGIAFASCLNVLVQTNAQLLSPGNGDRNFYYIENNKHK
jgi:hypothetical protein